MRPGSYNHATGMVVKEETRRKQKKVVIFCKTDVMTLANGANGQKCEERVGERECVSGKKNIKDCETHTRALVGTKLGTVIVTSNKKF